MARLLYGSRPDHRRDPQGHNFSTVGVGDLCIFRRRSAFAQARSEGCEFLLVFDDGDSMKKYFPC